MVPGLERHIPGGARGSRGSQSPHVEGRGRSRRGQCGRRLTSPLKGLGTRSCTQQHRPTA